MATPPTAIVLVPSPELRPTALGLIRCLGRAGVPVVAAAVRRFTPSYLSRYVSRTEIVPSWSAAPAAWQERLVAIARRIGDRPVLFASSDEHVWALHQHRDALSPHFRYPFLSRETLRCCIDKREMYRVAGSAGVETGRVVPIPDASHADEAVERAVFPSVLKPAAWVDLSGASGAPRRPFQRMFRQKALTVASRDELSAALTLASDLSIPLILQEEVPGPASAIHHVSLYADTGSNVRGLFVGRKSRQYPSRFGGACFLETEPCAEAAALTAALVRAAGFCGLAGAIEFKRHPATGRLHFLELNPRVGASVSVTESAGVNLPHLAYLDAIGEPIPPLTVGERPVRWVDGRRDFLYWLSYRGGDHAGVRMPFSEYLNSLRGRRECAYWAADDRWPGAIQATSAPRDLWEQVRSRPPTRVHRAARRRR
jgi:predicted ATP-grasp superfamily ATP-dependent carboligase